MSTSKNRPTGEFSVGGGYSTADGAIAEVSIADRNLMGRGQFAKASVQFGQYARGFDLSFVEPYLLGYRMSGGIDLYARENLANNYVTSYNTKSMGATARLGFASDRGSLAGAARLGQLAGNRPRHHLYLVAGLAADDGPEPLLYARRCRCRSR